MKYKIVENPAHNLFPSDKEVYDVLWLEFGDREFTPDQAVVFLAGKFLPGKTIDDEIYPRIRRVLEQIRLFGGLTKIN